MTNESWREGPRLTGLLIGFVVILLGSLWAIAWGSVQSNGTRINDLEKIVPVVETQYKDMQRRLIRIEAKIDNGR